MLAIVDVAFFVMFLKILLLNAPRAFDATSILTASSKSSTRTAVFELPSESVTFTLVITCFCGSKTGYEILKFSSTGAPSIGSIPIEINPVVASDLFPIVPLSAMTSRRPFPAGTEISSEISTFGFTVFNTEEKSFACTVSPFAA